MTSRRMGQALALMQKEPPAELLPTEVLEELGMPSLSDALPSAPRPASGDSCTQGT